MVAALSTVYPFFTSWMLTGNPKNFVQFNPKNAGWFDDVLKAMEGSESVNVLHEWADSMLEDETDPPMYKRASDAPKN